MKNTLKSRFFCLAVAYSICRKLWWSRQLISDKLIFNPLNRNCWQQVGCTESKCKKFHLNLTRCRRWKRWICVHDFSGQCGANVNESPHLHLSIIVDKVNLIYIPYCHSNKRNEIQRYSLPIEIPAKEKYKCARAILWYEKRTWRKFCMRQLRA